MIQAFLANQELKVKLDHLDHLVSRDNLDHLGNREPVEAQVRQVLLVTLAKQEAVVPLV